MSRINEEKSAFLKDEIEAELGDERQAQRAHKKWWSWGWAVVVVVALISLAANIFLLRRPRFGYYPTDMKDARRAVEYEIVTYTGALIFDPVKRGLVRINDGETEYFGPPSKAVDDAWQGLLHGQFPAMTDEEAKPYPNLTKLPDTDRYHFDPDMFHSLHCLNGIRSMLAGPLYGAKLDHMAGAAPADMRAHMDHCMDRLRQTIMCHGDLTPSPLYQYGEGAGPIGRSGQHTCRKWGPIRAWMDERGRIAPLYGED